MDGEWVGVDTKWLTPGFRCFFWVLDGVMFKLIHPPRSYALLFLMSFSCCLGGKRGSNGVGCI